MHVSTRRAGSTTSVVSPYASLRSTSPGTPSKVISRPEPEFSTRHSADLVRRRDARLDLLLEPDDALDERFRARRAAGHVDVDRDDLVDALQDRVVVEHPARAGARPHRDHPLRLEHLVVDLAQRRGHLVGDAAGDDEQVGLTRGRAEDLGAEARDVISRRDDRHHLDRAAREPERVGPDRVPLRPEDRLVDGREHQLVLEVVAELLLEDAGALALPEHALGVEAPVREALLLPHRHVRAPFRQMYTYASARIATKKPSSANPNHPSGFITTPSG